MLNRVVEKEKHFFLIWILVEEGEKKKEKSSKMVFHIQVIWSALQKSSNLLPATSKIGEKDYESPGTETSELLQRTATSATFKILFFVLFLEETYTHVKFSLWSLHTVWLKDYAAPRRTAVHHCFETWKCSAGKKCKTLPESFQTKSAHALCPGAWET